ncbi:MAG TPA: NTF2-like N-terminal transpeptidase domain-containing protein, partial [Paenisporosarcina sp.]|nr:NTF2-like N-terminal transpeptidase domain-containing protein [Paenisporosarcina sp.]
MKKGMMGVLLLLLVILLTGCQEEATPEERLAEYVNHWNKGNFAAMYKDYLNNGTKEVFSTENFVERQESLKKDLGIENVKVTYTKPAKDTEWNIEKPADFPIKVSMDTVAGPVEFEKTITLVNETRDEDENWFVKWDTSFIFPDLGEKDTVGISTSKPARGE